MKKKIIISTLVLLVVLALIPISLRLDMLGHKDVSAKLNHQETLFFYRDDCPTCQHRYPIEVWKKLTGQKIIFVNTNGKKNYYLVKQFQVAEVPKEVSLKK